MCIRDRKRRDSVLANLHQKGIGVAVNYRAISVLTYFREAFGFKKGSFPIAERIGDMALSLPFWIGLKDEDVDYVVSSLNGILNSV
jgi:UDP-4-amino-4-deoxy-L-arabinose-oxoglutarate aminotransferase